MFRKQLMYTPFIEESDTQNGTIKEITQKLLVFQK